MTRIVTDNAGTKWYATMGGLVQTSADGTHIIRQLTTDNSLIPSNSVYDICYNPESNSLFISTDKGYAEYFQPGSSDGSVFTEVKAYPNPVRPDYVGWITIEGLVDNCLVKIVDAAGNLVKELGHSAGGKVLWDGTNITNAKVNSGVYYIMSTSAGEGTSEANVGKILVVK